MDTVSRESTKSMSNYNLENMKESLIMWKKLTSPCLILVQENQRWEKDQLQGLITAWRGLQQYQT